MTRKLKALGLALVASLALSAVVASAAGAVEFHSEAEHTILSAGQTTEHKFSVGSGFGTITCKKAEFSGTSAAKTTTTQTVTPHYTECKDSLGRIVHVAVNGATYTFHPNAPGTVTVSEGPIVLTVTGSSSTCTVTIKKQTNSPIKFSNSGSGVLVTTEVNNVETTTSGGFFTCGVSDGAHTGGTYTGSSLTTGTDTTGKAVKVWVE